MTILKYVLRGRLGGHTLDWAGSG